MAMFFSRIRTFIALMLFLLAFSPAEVLAQCLAEYTAAVDVGETIREGNPITFTFTPTAGAGFDGCGAATVSVNFSLQFGAGSELEENDLTSTGSGFIWETGDALVPFDVVTTAISDFDIEVSELAELTAKVSAITGTGGNVPSAISGNKEFSFTVLDPNKDPVLTPFDAPDVTEDDSPVALGASAHVTDENEDNQTLTVTVTGGTVTTGTEDVTFGGRGGGNGTSSFTLSGTLDALNAALDAASFTPSADLSGTDVATVALAANDGFGGSASTSTTFSIAHVADTPSITDATTLEDKQNQAGLVITRAAVDGAEITHFRISSIVGGDVFLNDGTTPVADGSFVTAAAGEMGLRFLPDTDRVEAGSFSVEASLSADAEGVAGDAVPATIQITPVNDAPSFSTGNDITVDEDSGSFSEDGWATGMSPGPDDEGTQTLEFNVESDKPELFSVQPDVDATTGEMTFSTAANANGVTTVTISLTDSGDTEFEGVDTSADQTFTITVVAQNDAPVLTLPAAQTTLEDTPIVFSTGAGNAISVTDIDSDPDAVEVTLTATSHVTLSGIAGLTFSGDADGTADETMTFQGTVADVNAALDGLTFTPTLDAVTGASLTVAVSDLNHTGEGGALTDSGTITVNLTPVNDAPSFSKGPNISVNEDSGPHTSAGWATDRSPGPVDEASQTLTFHVSNDNSGLFAVEPAVDGATGDLTFTPAEHANGDAIVTISVQDSGLKAFGGEDTSAEQTFTIEVVHQNDAPVLTLPGPQTVLEDGVLTFSTGDGNAISISDLDANGQNVEVTLTATSHVTLSGITGLNFTTGSGTADETMTFEGTIADVNAALDGLTYVPSLDAVTGASLTVTVSDLGNTGEGGALTDSGTIPISLNPVNDAPSFSKGPNITVDEDSGAHTTAGWATARSAGPPDEEASQTLTFHVSTPESALFATQPAVDGATGDLTFTPAEHAHGVANVTISVQDSGGTDDGGVDTSADQTFTITLQPVNDAPVISLPPTQVTAEDTPLVLSTANGNLLSITDVDSDPGELEVKLTATSTVTLAGTAGLTFTAGDGTDDETTTFRGTLNDINAALDGLTYKPGDNAVSGASLTVHVSDLGNAGSGGTLTDEQTLAITLGDVNDPPSFQKGPDITVFEDAGLTSVPNWATSISPGPPDEQNQNVTFNVTIGAPAFFAEGPSIHSATGDLTFTTAPNANGTTQIWVELQDNGGTVGGGVDVSPLQVFSIHITPVNDAPVVTASDDLTVDENSELVLSSADGTAITVQDVDAGEGELDVTLTASSNASLSLESASGTLDAINATLDGLVFTPHPLENGPASITVTVSDRGNTGAPGDTTPLTTELTVPVSINPVNNPPVPADDAYPGFSGTPLTILPLVNDTDPENDLLSIASISTPSGGSATLGTPAADGRVTTIIYVANAEFTGTDTFTYTVEDAHGAPSTGTITVQVSGPGPDGDGVDDAIEAGAPNNGDGNGDGIPDSEQDNVASFPVRGSNSYVSVAAPTGQALARVGSSVNPSPANFPQGRGTPAGFVSYEVNDLTAGQSTIITVHLPPDMTADGYLKYGPTPDNPEPHWYDFGWDGTTGAQIQGNTIQLHLTDGLRGDDDLTANGTIVDPGAPVVTQNILPIVPDLELEVMEDGQLEIDLLAGTSDADGDPLSLVSTTFVSAVSDGPVQGDEAFELDQLEGGMARFTPAPDHFGTVVLTYAVSDGNGAPVAAAVNVTVTPVQDIPVAVDDEVETLMNEPVTFNILANDYDVDGDNIFLVQMDSAPSGKLTFISSGQVTYTPATDFSGMVVLGYTISDGPENSGALVKGRIEITVIGVPNAPVGVNDVVETDEDAPVVIHVLSNDTDINNDVLAVHSFTQPSHGTVAADATTLVYTPDPDFNGVDAFTYIPTDGALEGSQATVTVMVLPVNDAPHFPGESAIILPLPGPIALFAGGSVGLEVHPAMDVDGDTLTYRWQVSLDDSYSTILFALEDMPLDAEDAGFDVPSDELLAVLNAAGALTTAGERISLQHRLVAVDPAGAQAVGASTEVTFERATSVGVEDENTLPAEVYLRENYPNPFNPSTTIEFGLPEAGSVNIVLYDLQGKQVRVLVSKDVDAGHHRVRADLSGLASGVYLYRMQTDDRVVTHTLHLLK